MKHFLWEFLEQNVATWTGVALLNRLINLPINESRVGSDEKRIQFLHEKGAADSVACEVTGKRGIKKG